MLQDINECSDANICGVGSTLCINTNGSYTCDCAPGYHQREDKKGCEDIDECAWGNEGYVACGVDKGIVDEMFEFRLRKHGEFKYVCQAPLLYMPKVSGSNITH